MIGLIQRHGTRLAAFLVPFNLFQAEALSAGEPPIGSLTQTKAATTGPPTASALANAAGTVNPLP